MNQPVRDWMRGEVMVRRSPRVREMVAVGRENHWRFRPMGRASVPTAPVRLRDWMLVPVEQDSSHIPARSLERVQALYEAGVRPKAYILAHETPRTLTASTVAEAGPVKESFDWAKIRQEAARRAGQLAEHLPDWEVVGSVALKVLTVLGVTAGALAAVPVLLVGLVATAVLVDPILIAVTEDDYWVEIDRWWV